MKAKLGPDHPDTLTSMNNLGVCYLSVKRLDRSEPLLEEVVRLRIAKSGANHPDTLLAKANLAVGYKDAGRLAEAIPLLEEAADASRQFASLRVVKPQLADTYLRAGRSDKLAVLLKEQIAEARATLGTASPQLAGTLAQAGSTLISLKAWPDAEPILRECLAIRMAKEPDDWRTFNTKSMLGEALLGQKRYDEAEPLLADALDGLTKRAAVIPPQGKVRFVEAADRVISLYESWGKHDEAARWRVRLGITPSDAMPADPFGR